MSNVSNEIEASNLSNTGAVYTQETGVFSSITNFFKKSFEQLQEGKQKIDENFAEESKFFEFGKSPNLSEIPESEINYNVFDNFSEVVTVSHKNLVLDDYDSSLGAAVMYGSISTIILNVILSEIPNINKIIPKEIHRNRFTTLCSLALGTVIGITGYRAIERKNQLLYQNLVDESANQLKN